jgi:hypothetical protein
LLLLHKINLPIFNLMTNIWSEDLFDDAAILKLRGIRYGFWGVRYGLRGARYGLRSVRYGWGPDIYFSIMAILDL